MSKIEKTVFISYRRTNVDTALLIYQNLTQKGYDVFFDFESIKTGDFGKFIYQNIESRAHFVVILKPKTLDRCVNPDDWVRREIEHAVTHRRNIIPIAFDGFDLKDIDHYLPTLSGYNALSIPVSLGYFDDGIRKLIDRLNVSLDVVLHPVTPDVQAEAVRQQEIIQSQLFLSSDSLTAQEYFERGKKHAEMENWDYAINEYSKAINIKPDYADAYRRRSEARRKKGDIPRAAIDLGEAIQLEGHRHYRYTPSAVKRRKIEPNYNTYCRNGIEKEEKGNFGEATIDYTKAINLKPNDPDAYLLRAMIRIRQGYFYDALLDLSNAINLKPDDREIYQVRAVLREEVGDLDDAISDLKRALQLDSEKDTRELERVLKKTGKSKLELDRIIKEIAGDSNL